jgi:WD40 repeat protein
MRDLEPATNGVQRRQFAHRAEAESRQEEAGPEDIQRLCESRAASILGEAEVGSQSLAVEDTCEADDSRAPPPPANKTPSIPDLPVIERDRYSYEAEHARGGLGRIIEARDMRLDRTVAVKELLKSGDDAEARFIREALITARLQHPSIVPIHDLARDSAGKPFYSMKMVSGRSLAEVIEEKRTLAERLALLPNVIAVADAMAYAHGQRVIHRDLKPANVLIGPFGETVVIDWGLAAQLSETRRSSHSVATAYEIATSGLTVAGTVMGTPEYMPVEQAEGKPVDERADVYAIGAILYHVLAGQPPYQGSNSKEVLASIARQDPIPIEQRQPGVPRELATIIHKAMSRDANARYPSAKELAEDLKRFQTGQLVSAHSYTKLMLVQRWLARHRPLVALAAIFLSLSLAGGFFAIWRIIRERNLAASRRNELLLLQARNALEHDPTAAIAWLKSYATTGADPSPAWDMAVEAESAGVARHVFRRTYSKPSDPAFSPDGTLFASAGEGSTVRVYDLRSAAAIAILHYEGEVRAIAFSPTASLLLWSDWQSATIVLWDFRAGMVRKLSGHSGVIYRTRFSPDGQLIASSGDDRTVRLWNVSTGEHRILYTHKDKIPNLNFSYDGKFLVSAGNDGVLTIWDLITNVARNVQLRQRGNNILAVAPSAPVAACSTSDGTIEVYNLETGGELSRYKHQDTRWFPAFSADSRQLALAGGNGVIDVIELATQRKQSLVGHDGQVTGVTFSKNGKFLVSIGQDGTVRLWNLTTGQDRMLRGHRGGVYGGIFSADDKYLASLGSDGTVRIWDLDSMPPMPRILRGHSDRVLHLAFSPDGSLAGSAGADGTVRVWNTITGRLENVYEEGHTVVRIRFSPDGRWLASSGMATSVSLRDLQTAERREFLGNKRFIWDIQFSRSGSLIASASDDGAIRVWNVLSREESLLENHLGPARALAFSPDDLWLASAGGDGLVRLLNVSDGRSRLLRGHQGVILSLAFSPAGDVLASAGYDKTVRLWNLASGSSQVLMGHTGIVRSVAFSGDGKLLASGAEDHSVRLWDIERTRLQSVLHHDDEVVEVAFAPDGRMIASASSDNSVRLWQTETAQLVGVLRHGDHAFGVVFSSDGKYVGSSSADKTVRLLEVGAMTLQRPGTVSLLQKLENSTTAVLRADGKLATE